MSNSPNDSMRYLMKDSRFKGLMNDSMDYSMHDLTTDSMNCLMKKFMNELMNGERNSE